MGGGMLAGNSLASILILRDGNRLFVDCFGDRSVQKVVSVTSCMLTAIQAMPFGEQIRTFTWRAQKTPLKASDALLHQEIIMTGIKRQARLIQALSGMQEMLTGQGQETDHMQTKKLQENQLEKNTEVECPKKANHLVITLNKETG